MPHRSWVPLGHMLLIRADGLILTVFLGPFRGLFFFFHLFSV